MLTLSLIHILVLGVSYKQDIDDYRDSPALKVIECLEERGAEVVYFDPWVPEYHYRGETKRSLSALTVDELETADLVMITCGHTNVDYSLIQSHAHVILDTKNAMKNVSVRDNIEVL